VNRDYAKIWKIMSFSISPKKIQSTFYHSTHNLAVNVIFFVSISKNKAEIFGIKLSFMADVTHNMI
jgi:hypothetical protein